jgi:hydrogenase nickel incorporation protein HypA/HybF
MHELSIAQNIIEIVKDYVPEKDYKDVKSIMLKIGEMSGIVADSLEFCFEAIKIDTPLSNSKLVIEKIPFMLFCNKCKSETSNTFGVRICDKCGETDTYVVSGTDMKITEIELDS